MNRFRRHNDGRAWLTTSYQFLGGIARKVYASRVLRSEELRSVSFAFVSSRALVLTILILGAIFVPKDDPYNPGMRIVSLSVHKIQIARILKREVLVGDANWYIGIAAHGYEHSAFEATKAHNWAFFPLFPLLLKLAHKLTGEFEITAIALSHFFFFVALLLFHKLCIAFGLVKDASRAIFYLAFYPVSYFFSLPLTESLFLMLMLGSFVSAKKGHWWLAGVIGALASATRLSGLLLIPALVVLYLQANQGRRPRLRFDLCWLLLIPVGLLVFMLYLRAITGSAWAFTVQTAWGRRPGLFFMPLLNYLQNPSGLVDNWDFRLLNFAGALAVIICGAILIRLRQFALATYSLLSALMALSTTLLQSQARYAMVVFPVYIVLAHAGRHHYVDQTIRMIFVALLTLMTALFAAHFALALS